MGSDAGSAPPVLVVPEGWMVAPSAQDRLRHQLAVVAEEVAGIGAPVLPLPAGATYRSFAARRGLTPRSALVEAGRDEIAGAVLLRPGVPHAIGTDGVRVGPSDGRVLIDPGAPSFDPRMASGPLESATAEARSPFRCRPTVVLLACSDHAELLAWAQTMVNELIPVGVDACLAAPRPVEGAQLARPCRADRPSILALRPDVVVTLDVRAKGQLDAWAPDARGTLVIEFTTDPDVGVELVSWRLDAADGRVRARVGRAAAPSELAAVVDRLCGGPHPITRDEAGAAVAGIRSPRRPQSSRLKLAVIDGAGRSAPDGSAGLAAVADRLVASGHEVQIRAAGPDPHVDLARSDHVILRGVRPTPEVRDTIDARARAGRTTVVWLSPDDVEVVRPGASRSLRVVDGVAELVQVCGRAIAPSRAVADLVDGPATVLALAPMITRADEAAFGGRSSTVGTTVRWQVDGPPSGERAAVGEALARVLDRHGDLTIELTGESASIADLGAGHGSRVRLGGGPAGGHRAAAESDRAMVWTVDDLDQHRRGDGGPLVAAGFAGVPTIVSASNPAVGLVAHPRELRVTEVSQADGWFEVLDPLLADPDVRSRHAAAVERSVTSLFGAETSELAVNRLVGWLRSGSIRDA